MEEETLMKNWKNSVYALFAMICVLIFAGCQPMSGGTKPTGTVPGSTGGNDLNAVEKAIVGSFKLPDGIVFKFNSDRTGTKTTPASGNIRAAQPVQNFTWKADTSGNVSMTFKDGSASPVVKFDMNHPNEIKIDGDVAIKDGATDLNEYERKLVGFWTNHGSTDHGAHGIRISVAGVELKSDGTGTRVYYYINPEFDLMSQYIQEVPITWKATETSIMCEITEELPDVDSNLFGVWIDYSLSEEGILEWEAADGPNAGGTASLKRSKIFDELVGVWVSSTEAGTSSITISPYMTGFIKNSGNSTEYNFVIAEITDTKIIGYQGLDQVEIPYRMKDNRTAFIIPSTGRQDFYEDTHTGTPDIKYVKGDPTQPPESNLNEYERKLLGTWYGGGIEMELNEDKTVSSVFDPRLQGDISAKATWNSTANTLTLNWYEATRDGQILSGQEKEWVFDNFGGNPTVWKYTWKDNDNVTVNIRSEPELMSRKPYYNVFYTYDDVGGRVIKKEYVEIGKNYNIDFKYGEDCFKYVDIPQKYWKFEKYKITTKFPDQLGGTEYKPGDSAIIPSPTAYQIYYLKICDTRDVIHIVYKVNGSREGDTYWFYDGNSYAKHDGTWKSDLRTNIKAGDIIGSAYIENRESELKCIGWVKSSLTSISASDIYERADPAIGWTVDSPIELIPVFVAW